MENFSLLVRKKYDELSVSEKKIFDDELLRRKSKLSSEEIDVNDLALEIFRDLALVLNEKPPTTKVLPINAVNTRNFNSQNKSKGNYVWLIIVLVFAMLFGVGTYTRPDWLKMENKVVDKMLENKPSMIAVFKNLFLGTELNKQKAEGVISNLLKMEGFQNIEMRNYDWVFLRKMEILNSNNSKSLVTAYGLFGQTIVKLNFRDDNFLANVEKDNEKLEEEYIDEREFEGAENSNYVTPSKNSYQPLEGVRIRPSVSEKEDIVEEKNSNDNENILKNRNSLRNENEDNNIGDSIKIN